MGGSCKNCGLNYLLEENRRILNELISEKDNMVDNIVVKQSQVLDHFVAECVKCKRGKEEQHKKELDNVFGMHFSFYYYGISHLFVNLIPYIKDGVENNELVTVSLTKDIFDKLMELLDSHGIDKSRVIFFSVKNLIIANNKNGIEGVKVMLSALLKEVEENNYSGVRMIGQPSFAIKETSKEEFLKLEEILTEVLLGSNASVFCIYDAFDYINSGSIIDENIILKSFETHSYYLNYNMLNGL